MINLHALLNKIANINEMLVKRIGACDDASNLTIAEHIEDSANILLDLAEEITADNLPSSEFSPKSQSEDNGSKKV